jgi:hypothetical protein
MKPHRLNLVGYYKAFQKDVNRHSSFYWEVGAKFSLVANEETVSMHSLVFYAYNPSLGYINH